MEEFSYFTRDIEIRKGRYGLSWIVNIPELSTFKELTERFNECLKEFETNIMCLENKDRSLVSSLAIDDLITTLIDAKRCAREDDQAPQSVAFLCMTLENGIRTILNRIEKLDIVLLDYIIERMEKLTKTTFIIRKKIDGNITEEETGLGMKGIFIPYLRKINNKDIQQTTDTTGDDLLTDGTFGSDTQKAKNLFKRAVEAGLCKVSDGKYKWSGSKALLAYFAEKASLYLELGKGEYNGNPKTSWKPFEKFFSVEGLSNNRNDNRAKSNEPKEYKKVDDLFR